MNLLRDFFKKRGPSTAILIFQVWFAFRRFILESQTDYVDTHKEVLEAIILRN
jgi:hypothetical protein